jgi:hypothetical protein
MVAVRHKAARHRPLPPTTMTTYVDYEPYRDRDRDRDRRDDPFADDSRRAGDSDFVHPSNKAAPSSTDHISNEYPPHPPTKRHSQTDPLSPNAAPIDGYRHKEEPTYRPATNGERRAPIARDVGNSRPADVDESGDERGPFTRFLAQGRYPLEQRIENKKRGIGVQKYPFVCEFFHRIMRAYL